MIGFENDIAYSRALPPIGLVTAMYNDSKRDDKEKSKARKNAEDFSLIFEEKCDELRRDSSGMVHGG